MRKALKALPVLLIAAASIQAALHAQAPAQDQPAAVGWILTPSIRFGGAWDDNILLANAGDNPPGDYATPVGPALDLEYRGRRTRLTTGYQGSFLLYRTFDELNSTEQNARARFDHRATRRLAFFAEEIFIRVPTTDALQGVAGIPFYRVGSQMNTVATGFDAFLSRHTNLRGKYSFNDVTFNQDQRFGGDLQGGHAHEVTVGLDRALSSQLTIGAEYDGRRAITTQGLDRFNTHTGSVTMQYDITRTLTVSGLAGVSRLDSGLLQDSRIGPALRAAITQRSRYVVLSAVYSKSFIPSFGFGGTFQNEEWQGVVHVPFAGLRGYADGSIARLNNEPLEAVQPSLRSTWLTGTLGYRLTRWLSVEGYYAQSQQTSNRPGSDLGRHQVGFRMVASKPMRLAR